MSRELRKDPKPRRPFEQAGVRSQSQSAVSPVKRPAKRRQQFATHADEAVDAVSAGSYAYILVTVATPPTSSLGINQSYVDDSSLLSYL